MKVITQTNTKWLPLLTVLEGQHRHAISVRPPTDIALYSRFTAIKQRVQEDQLPVHYVGTMPVFEHHRVYHGQQYDWVLLNSREDPLMQDPDGFPVPAHVLAQLQRIQQANLHFDAIYVAHEVPHGTINPHGPLDPKQLLPPPPRAVHRLSAQLGNISQSLWTVATLPLVAIGRALSTAAAFSSVAVGLDPILLGVIVGEHRSLHDSEPAAWFYLAHWAYNQED